jgi:hypothetical protein
MELAHAGISPPTLREQAAHHSQALARTLDAVMTDWFTRLALI